MKRAAADGIGTAARTETFVHDRLGLTEASTSLSGGAARTLSIAYDRLGNLAGRVTRDDGGADGTDRHFEWNARGLLKRAVAGASLADPAPESAEEYAHGPDGERYYRMSTWRDNGGEGGPTHPVEHRFYVGSFEERIGGGAGEAERPADRPADSEPPPGVPMYEGPARPDYWEWPVFPGPHYYEVLSAPICAVSECDYNEVIKVLNEKAVHPKQVEPFDPNSDVIYEADVDLPIPYSGKDTVRVEPIRADNELQIRVKNTALGDHALRPGTVSRTGVAHEGVYHIRTVGRGRGWLPWLNVDRAGATWGEIDQLIIDEFRGQR